MRVHYIALLVSILLASVDAATVTSDSTTSQPVLARSLITGPKDLSVNRFLRKHETVNTDNSANDEERVFGVVALDDIAQNAAKTWKEIVRKKQLKSLASAKTNANDAYGVLKLDKVTDNLLQSGEWKTWSTYVATLGKSNTDEAMVKSLVQQLKPDKLSKVLAGAAKNPTTKELATRLDDAHIKWLVDYSGTPHDIFKKLTLNTAADDLFTSPQFATYMKYLKTFNEEWPKRQTTMFDVFKKSYGEEGVLKLLTSGKNMETAGAMKIADDMIAGWLEFFKSPYSVFKVLSLDKAGGNLLSNPLLSTWVKYMNQFNEKLPTKKTTMIETFLKSYGDETLTKMLEAAKKVPATEKFALNLEKAKTALFSKWMTEGITPDHLFKNVLKLDPASMARNPNTNIWRAYYNAYDKANPGKLFSFNP